MFKNIFCQHEIIKTLTVITLRITDGKLKNKSTCSNISKTE